MIDCKCGKQFEATDDDGVLYCTKCKTTKGLAAGRTGAEASQPTVAESGEMAKADPPPE